MRKRKAKEVREFDEFEVKMKVVKTEVRMSPGKKVWSKCVGIRQDPNKPWYESSGLRPREGSTQSKSRTKCAKRCGWSSGYFALHPRQSSLQHVHVANASFAESEGLAETRYHFVLRGTSAGKERFGVCSRIAVVFETRVKCLQHTWRRMSTNTVFRKTQWCCGGTGKQR